MKKPEVSVIITTFGDKTLYALENSFPKDWEIVISRKLGVAHARNWGAQETKGKKLVFVDDDIIADPWVWKYVKNLEKNELYIVEEASTRIMMVYRSTFRWMCGFDEYYSVSGEDRDFMLRAIRMNLNIRFFPHSSYCHVTHPIRGQKDKKTSLRLIRQHAHMIRKHNFMFKCIYPHPFRKLLASWSYQLHEFPLSYMFWDFVKILCLPFVGEKQYAS